MTTEKAFFAWSLLVVLTVSGAGLTGCASPAEKTAMVVSLPAGQAHPYSVSIVTQGGNETGAVDIPSVSNEDLAGAIEESIVKSGLFREVVHGQTGDYILSVTITETTKPLWGTSFRVTMEAGWSLTSAKTRETVLRKVIQSSYTATTEDSLAGVTRFRMAVEGATRENIRLGLTEISRLTF